MVVQTRQVGQVKLVEIEDWAKNALESHQNHTKEFTVNWIDNSSGKSSYWQARESWTGDDTSRIIENGFPGMRKEIPEAETFNKYGDAARAIELQEFRSREAVKPVHISQVPRGAKFVTGRFVYTLKEKPVGIGKVRTAAHIDDVRKLDARLRARGFTETMWENVSAPTISLHTVRALFAVTPVLKWRVRIVDISRAFLQSKELERELYMYPPKGTELDSQTVWRVVKPIYGLCDATKSWHETFGDFVHEVGGKESIADPAMYYWTGHGQKEFFRKAACNSWEDFDYSSLPKEVCAEVKAKPVFGCIAVHVDDVAIFGDMTFINWLTQKIKGRFDTKEFKEDTFDYLGMAIVQKENCDITMEAKGYEREIEMVQLDCDRECSIEEPLTVQEEKEFRSSLGKLMWIARLTRPDLAFESAAAAQKYGKDQDPNKEYIGDDLEDTCNASEEAIDQWSDINTKHMPGFQECLGDRSMVQKVCLGKKKRKVTNETHLKIKNALFLNKAIRKLRSRDGAKVIFTDISDGRIGELKIVIHCDAGSIKTIDKSKSQIGVLGMIQNRDPIEIHPKETFRNPDICSARKAVRNHPYVRATPIFWTSGKTERVAESSFAAELQSVYTAFDAGTVLRQLYSEVLYGHPKGSVKVEIRNDQLSVINALNGITAMPSDRKLSGTMCSLREMLNRGEIRDVKHVPGEFNMADALTKSVSGNSIFHLMQFNRCAVRPATEIKEKFSRTAPGKQYLFLQDLKRRKMAESHLRSILIRKFTRGQFRRTKFRYFKK